MKTLLTLGLGLALASTSTAEVRRAQVPITCVDSQDLLRMLDNYNEVPFIGGETERGFMLLYVNAETRTWTLVERVQGPNRKWIYCVHTDGQNFGPVEEAVREGFLQQRRDRYD